MSSTTSGTQPLLERACKDDPEELFELVDVIGNGAFGTVCSCLNKQTLEMVAVKFIPIESEDTFKLQREIDIMKKIPYAPEIVKYFGCYVKDNMLLIVMEYCDGGSLMDILRACNKTLEEAQIAAASAAVVRGLQHLHKTVKIMHRDVKAANVLLNSKGEAKLADFGVSAQLATSAQRQKTVIGSPYWMAPEVIDQADSDSAVGYNNKSDIWSLGITAIELAEGKPPHYDLLPIRAILKIPNEDPPTLKDQDKWSPAFHDFLAKCLMKDPEHRPTAQELLDHPFIKAGAKNQKHILAELVEASMPDLIKARLESANESDSEETSREASWFSMEPGTVLSFNSDTMRAKIAAQPAFNNEDKDGTVVLSKKSGTS
ncbi:Plant dual-specificity MAP kinase kinase family domain protein [Balamuthia mandrillaris]